MLCDLQQPSGSYRNIGCVYTATSGTITLTPSQTKDFTLRLYLRDCEPPGVGIPSPLPVPA